MSQETSAYAVWKYFKEPFNSKWAVFLASDSPVRQALPIRQGLTSPNKGIGSSNVNNQYVHRRGNLAIYLIT